jgi:hypothetical protein
MRPVEFGEAVPAPLLAPARRLILIATKAMLVMGQGTGSIFDGALIEEYKRYCSELERRATYNRRRYKLSPNLGSPFSLAFEKSRFEMFIVLAALSHFRSDRPKTETAIFPVQPVSTNIDSG